MNILWLNVHAHDIFCIGMGFVHNQWIENSPHAYIPATVPHEMHPPHPFPHRFGHRRCIFSAEWLLKLWWRSLIYHLSVLEQHIPNGLLAGRRGVSRQVPAWRILFLTHKWASKALCISLQKWRSKVCHKIFYPCPLDLRKWQWKNL